LPVRFAIVSSYLRATSPQLHERLSLQPHTPFSGCFITRQQLSFVEIKRVYGWCAEGQEAPFENDIIGEDRTDLFVKSPATYILQDVS
jgi:hypothetical protein